LKYSF
jgi:hypothetical protein